MGFRRSLAFSLHFPASRGGVHNRQGRPGQPIYREQPMSTANYREHVQIYRQKDANIRKKVIV